MKSFMDVVLHRKAKWKWSRIINILSIGKKFNLQAVL